MKKEAEEAGKAGINKKWQAQISAWRRSGLSGKEYCRRQQISYDAFTYWRRKFEAETPQGLSLVPVASILAAGGNSQAGPGLKVDLGDRLKIEVYDGFSQATLTRLISTLRGC